MAPGARTIAPLAVAQAVYAAAIALAVVSGRWSVSRVATDGSLLSYLPSPRIVAVGLAILSLVATIAILRGRAWISYSALAFSPFLAFAALSTAWSSQSEESIVKLQELIFLSIFSVPLVLPSSSHRTLLPRYFWMWLFVFTAVLAALAVPLAFTTQGRLAALGGGPNVFARLMLVLSLSSMYFFRESRRLLFAGVLPLAALLLLLAGSRGGVLAAAVALLIAVRRKSYRFAIVGGAIGILAWSWAVQMPSAPVLERYTTQTFTSEGIYTAGRNDLYRLALDMFLDNSWIGAGLGEFEYRVGTYPHNLILEILVECGLLGALLFVLALIPLFKRLRSHIDQNRELVALFFGYLVASQFSGDIFDNRAVFIVGAILLNLPRERRELQSSSRPPRVG